MLASKCYTSNVQVALHFLSCENCLFPKSWNDLGFHNHYVHIAIDQSNHSRWPTMWDKKHKHQNIKSCTLHSILITYFGLDTLVMNIKLFLTVLSVCKIWAKGVTITSSCLTTKPKPLLPTILCYDSQIIYGHKSWLVLINILFVSSTHQTKNYSTFWLISSYSYISTRLRKNCSSSWFAVCLDHSSIIEGI